jgi:hypothetical protein
MTALPRAAFAAAIATALCCLSCTSALFAQTPGQNSQVRQLESVCRNTTGSKPASDSLAQLKDLDASMTDRDAAISTCQTKADNLRQTEDAEWIRALAALNKSNCVDAKRWLDGLQQRPTYYQRQARDEYARLSTCVQQAPSKDTAEVSSSSCNSNRLQNAEGAFRTRDFTQARALAVQLTACQGALGQDALSLLGKISAIEINNKNFTEALSATQKRDFGRACELLLKVETTDPKYPGLDQARIKGGCKTSGIAGGDPHRGPPSSPNADDTVNNGLQPELSAQKNNPSRNTDPKLEADKLRALGDLQAALNKAMEARALRPSDPVLVKLVADIKAQQAYEDQRLTEAVKLYYAGKYSDAQNQLNVFLSVPHSASMEALAHFYVAAIPANQYFLSGSTTDELKKHDDLKKQALVAFKELDKMYPAFGPPLDTVSPKVRMLYLEAVGRQQ